MPNKDLIDFLIVDDDNEFVEMISDLLNDYFGYEGHVAYDGLFALDMIQNNNYRFIITDYVMSTVNGDVLINKIRDLNSLNKDTFILVITGYIDELGDKLDGLENIKILTKPVKAETISREILKGIESSASLA